MPSLLIRVSSSVIALLLMVATIYFLSIQGLLFLCVAVAVLALRELVRLIFPTDHPTLSRFRYGFLVSIGLAVILSAYVPLETSLVVVFLGMLVFIFGALVVLGNMNPLDDLGEGIARGLMGFFYLGTLPSFIFQIIKMSAGIEWFLAFLTIVFCGDTLAFFIGSVVGKHKVLPSISPGKTWEGAAGGLLGSAFGAWASVQVLLPELREFSLLLIVLGLFVGGAAQMGDFFESLLKRLAKVKDSGSLMPGHGGVLDRIDGLLFAGPVMFFGIQLVDYFKALL